MGIITLVYLSSKKIIIRYSFAAFLLNQKKKEVYMSSLYIKYLEKKKLDKETYYLFKTGNFYIFFFYYFYFK